MSTSHLESDLNSDPKNNKNLKDNNMTIHKPSELSKLFKSDEMRPLNAYIVTSKVPPIVFNSLDTTPSSFKSSSYFTANSTGEGMSEEDTQSIASEDYGNIPSSYIYQPNYLSRTISTNTNYLDYQSEYEVILDDGTKQRRTVSLSTVQPVPSHNDLTAQPQSDDIPSYTSNFNPTYSKKINKSNNENDPLILNTQRQSNLDTSSESEHSSDSQPSFTRDRSKKQKSTRTRFERYRKQWRKFGSNHLTLSHQQKMVLKCSIAYFIGCLFTFVPQLHALCGTHIASHLAATVTVFFNPSKSVGGMIEAAGFGWLYTLSALTLSMASMYTADYFLENDMKTTAYVISLGVYLAGSTFVISFFKAKINTPSIFTASGLAFIIIFTVILRQGSGNEAELSLDFITETFSIVAIGSGISFAVCIFIWPMTASKRLRSEIASSLSSAKVLLKLLTKTFLLDSDLPDFTANQTLEGALKSHRASFTTLKSALADARLEFYNLQMRYHAEGYQSIVESLERLAQHIGGLKSSCGLQVEVLLPTAFNLKAGPQRKKMEDGLKQPGALVEFIQTIRAPMKSLAYTSKQTIVHLQARVMNKTETPSFGLMRQNLKRAIELFESSQQIAIMRFYKRKFKKEGVSSAVEYHRLFLSQHQFPAEDIFLVYFFVFCLLEFAKELMTLTEAVQYVFEDMEELDQTGSIFAWTKYLFKPKKTFYKTENHAAENATFIPNNHNTFNTLHTPAPQTRFRKFLLRLWGFFSTFRSHQFKFALKSMLTAEAVSVLAFLPQTRPYFTAFKMEWTLITVMAVMMPTVGSTNLGAILRVMATILGCVMATTVYSLFSGNTPMLAFMSWLVSIPSFWMILHHKHGRFGLFSLLAYNLIVLYQFNKETTSVYVLAWMRCVAVSLGVVIGLVVTSYVWPYEARTQVRKGLSDLLIRFSWLYRQLVESDGDVQSLELAIQVDLMGLSPLLAQAPNEPRLKGPFPAKTYGAMLACCQSILDHFLTLRIVVLKDVWTSHVRHHFLMSVSDEFMEMAGNVILYFYLLASALQLKTPLPPFLPPAEKSRRALMASLQQTFAQTTLYRDMPEERRHEYYMVYYAYVVLMENIIRELETLGSHMKELFGTIVPDDQWARCFGKTLDLEQNRYI